MALSKLNVRKTTDLMAELQHTRSCCPCRDCWPWPPGGVPDRGVEAAAVEADQVVLGQLYVAQRGRGLRPPAQGH